MPRYSGLFGNIHGQEEQRRVETFLDQHGREYTANVEITTGDPCAALMPIGWTAPSGPEWFRGLLMPPDHIRQMVPRMERARKRYQIEINYTQWLQEIDERNDAWDMRLQNLAQSSTKGLGFADVIANPPPQLLDFLGAKAFPPRVFIEACAAGDRWALGLSDRVPSKAIVKLQELESIVKRQRPRRGQAGLVNPFADEDDEKAVFDRELGVSPDDATADIENPFKPVTEKEYEEEALDDLDELFDPEAKGGHTEKVRRGRSKAER